MTEWEKIKIDKLCTIVKGITGLAKATSGQYPLVTTGHKKKTCNEYQFNVKAVCIPLVSSTGHGKKTLNYVHYQEGKFALGTILAAVIPNDDEELDARYLHLYLTFYKDRILVPLMRGAANVSLSIKDLKNIYIPVPPINIQKSIIAKYYKIKPESDELLEIMNHQSKCFKQLRQVILQEAVEGKLTANWRKIHPELISGENSVKNLLKKIKIEKEQLIKEKKIKNQKPLSPISEEEKPFKISEGWAWTRLGEVIILGENINIHNVFSSNTLINYVDLNCIDNKNHKLREIKSRKVSELSSRARRILKKGYIAYSLVRPYLCNMFIVKENRDKFIGSTGLCVFKPIQLKCKYFFYFLLSKYIYTLFFEKLKGFNSPTISLEVFLNTPIPLLNIDEQQAIVDRIDNLMNIVNKLEKQVIERKEQTTQLMHSVLREAFKQK